MAFLKFGLYKSMQISQYIKDIRFLSNVRGKTTVKRNFITISGNLQVSNAAVHLALTLKDLFVIPVFETSQMFISSQPYGMSFYIYVCGVLIVLQLPNIYCTIRVWKQCTINTDEQLYKELIKTGKVHPTNLFHNSFCRRLHHPV